MKYLNRSSGFALFVAMAFLTAVSLGPVLTGCGGGGSGGSSGGGGDDDEEGTGGVTFGTVQTATSGTDGTASISASVSGKTISFTLEDSAGQAASGLNIEYVEATDNSAALAVISGSGFQTTAIVLDSVDLSSDTDINARAFTASGEEVDFFIVTAATIVYITLVILTAKTIYDICVGVYELVGDPPDVSLYGSVGYACLSPAQVLNGLGLTYNTYSLITMGSLNAAKTAVQEGSKKVLEVVGPELLEEGAVTVAEETLGYFADWMAASTDDEGMGYDRDTHYCVELYSDLTNKSARFATAANITGLACSDSNGQADADICTSAAVEAARATAPSEGLRDRDKDGYYEDTSGDGFTAGVDDCNDGDATVHPGQVEICGNNKDDDCDSSLGQTDASCADDMTVEISSPGYWAADVCGGSFRNGVCYGTDRALQVESIITASDPDSATAHYMVNGHWSVVDIQDNFRGAGTYGTSSTALLKCDSAGYINQFSVVVDDGSGGYAYHEIPYGCDAEASDLLVMLFWDQCEAGDGTDLDLYVKEPGSVYAYDTLFDNWGEESSVTSNGGRMSGTTNTCMGPVYYYISDAPNGTYQFRIHYKTGSTSPNYVLYIIADESFDDAQRFTDRIISSNAANTGTACFSQSCAGWVDTTWSITKIGVSTGSSDHFWTSGED